MLIPCLYFSPRVFSVGSDTICYDKDLLTLMDFRLIVMKPGLTQKEKPLMESWVQSYLTIYPSLFFSSLGTKVLLDFVHILFFFTSVLVSRNRVTLLTAYTKSYSNRDSKYYYTFKDFKYSFYYVIYLLCLTFPFKLMIKVFPTKTKKQVLKCELLMLMPYCYLVDAKLFNVDVGVEC